MNALTHQRALAAAARLALASCALEACDKDRAEPPPPAPAPEHPTADPQADAPQPDAPTHASNESTPPPADPIRNCQGLVDQGFPKESAYPGDKRNVGTEVQACCAELLVHEGADIGRHRWDCCANLPADREQDGKLMMACTPWGPPVPPAMPRARTEVA